jgi:hypothetical protein
MALTTCAECYKLISDYAAVCPNCGARTVAVEKQKQLKDKLRNFFSLGRRIAVVVLLGMSAFALYVSYGNL